MAIRIEVGNDVRKDWYEITGKCEDANNNATAFFPMLTNRLIEETSSKPKFRPNQIFVLDEAERELIIQHRKK